MLSRSSIGRFVAILAVLFVAILPFAQADEPTASPKDTVWQVIVRNGGVTKDPYNGVVVSADGFIVTSAEPFADCLKACTINVSRIEVDDKGMLILASKATLVAKDVLTNLALIKTDDALPPAQLDPPAVDPKKKVRANKRAPTLVAYTFGHDNTLKKVTGQVQQTGIDISGVDGSDRTIPNVTLVSFRDPVVPPAAAVFSADNSLYGVFLGTINQPPEKRTSRTDGLAAVFRTDAIKAWVAANTKKATSGK